MLSDLTLQHILNSVPRLAVAVLGDLFLDRYLDIDGALTEPSLETGLDAYQVVRVRSIPGAAGTVINNLAALGVRAIPLIAVIADDGEGHELRQALARLPMVETTGLINDTERRTPTYTKPMFAMTGSTPRELNRFDIKNRSPLPAASETEVLRAIERLGSDIDALLVVDQVSEPDCGVVTAKVRERLAVLGADFKRIVLADSRERIGLFTNARLKPNARECRGAVPKVGDTPSAAAALADRCGRTVFCTDGERGTWIAEPGVAAPHLAAAFPVSGQIDPVGAGDSTSAAIACALASGVTPIEAAAFGNLVASITIQQIGTTGTASPELIRVRWQEVRR